MNDEFEAAFGAFLNRREYDRLQGVLFGSIRIAFLAGWKAAGGEPPDACPVVSLPLRQTAQDRQD